MPVSNQLSAEDRYLVSLRTAIFVRRGDAYLLIKGAPGKRLWAGKYNAVGGHIEPGEDALAAARRELYEETGLNADLWLCGTVMVDAGETGVLLLVFAGEDVVGDSRPSAEGTVEWLTPAVVAGLPVVEDLPALLERISVARKGDPPFSARSHYDPEGRLQIRFA